MSEASHHEPDEDGGAPPASGDTPLGESSRSAEHPVGPEVDAGSSSVSAGDTSAAEAEVAAVLDQVRSLPERPVDEHVAVLEDAHRRLRQTLDSTRHEG